MNKFCARPTTPNVAMGANVGDTRVVSFTSDKALPSEGKEKSHGTLLRLLSPRAGSPIQPNLEQQQNQPQQKLGFAASKRKQKRMTLPCIVAQPASQQIRGLISPSHLAAVNRRISFTYHNQPTIMPAPSFCPQATRQSDRRMEERNLRIIQRKKRNKLCSEEFSFIHLPRALVRISSCTFRTAKTRNHISFIEEDPHNKGVCDSKIASTIASRSSFRQRASNDFTLPCQPSSSRQSSSHCIKNPSNLTIQDPPSSKQIPQSNPLQAYSFGGLFSRSLLNTSNLKESIHCGPELRLQRPRLELLDRLGREIKESSLSFCE